MLKISFLSALLLLLLPTATLADSASGPESEYRDVILVNEDFEGVFPPAGWTIRRTNPDQTWEQEDCDHFPGRKCARAQGTPTGVSEEWLISPAIQCNYCAITYFDFDRAPAADQAENRLQLLYSKNFGDNQALASFTGEISYSALNSSWGGIQLSGNSVWIALKYSGQNGAGIEVNRLNVTANEEYYPSNNNYNSGDDAGDDDNGNSDDDAKACGCTVSQEAGSSFLAGLMTLVGATAFIISARRKRPY